MVVIKNLMVGRMRGGNQVRHGHNNENGYLTHDEVPNPLGLHNRGNQGGFEGGRCKWGSQEGLGDDKNP